MHPNFRRDFFFWLGVVIFPVFWAWFTLGKKFSTWQRYAAFGWLTAMLAAFAITWPQMAERYYLISLGLPCISFWVSFCLWVWLALRVFSFFEMFLAYVTLGGLLGALQPSYMRHLMELPLQDFSFHHVMMPLLPALLHLVPRPPLSVRLHDG